MTTVADHLINTLIDAGVQRIYGIVGDSLNGITKKLQHTKKIQWVHTRHEEVAAFAAGAESQLTGKLTVCAGSCGPGNLHLINGLYDCQRSQTPVLAIAAQIPTSELGSAYFQETHPEILFKECSYFCEVLTSPEQMPRLLHLAMQTAIAKRGVAVIVISGDMAMQTIPKTQLFPWTNIQPPVVVPTFEQLTIAADYLNNANNITLFCGIGCANAHDFIVATCKTLQAPVVHTLRGKPYVEPNNPYDVGMTGFIGFSSGYHAMESCDVLLLVGASFPYRQFYPTKARVIQIDIDAQQLGKRTAIDLGLIGDTKATLQALLPLLKQKTDHTHLTHAINHYKKAREKLNELASPTSNKDAIHPQYLTKLISQYASSDTIFTCDVGTPTVWAARYLTMNGERRLLGSFNHGSMANALAQGIGAQISHPKRQVIALCGDGGFSMLMGDILTMIQHDIPLKIVIYNNSTLNFVKLEMHVAGMLEYGTDLCATNFAKLAEAIGIHSVHVNDASQLDGAIQAILAYSGPALLDVKTNPNELIIPPTITATDATGFGLYVMKAILDGKGNEVLALAKDTLT
jgi:thiamine pyrophosphate-dependent acetolactate synthase large subunit-like protein